MQFYKYQGTGNDFIMINGFEEDFNLSQPEIELLCHRRFGIGADGLIVLKKSENYDFEMLYHNADGHVGSMCGNGGRCTVQFAFDLGLIGNKTKFIAADGEHEAEVTAEVVSLKMGEISKKSIQNGDFFVNTGSPHIVRFVDDIKDFEVFNEGKQIRYSDFWTKQGGANVNFTEQIGENEIFVRTYERGVEDETYSCGTGVTAAAIIASEQKSLSSPVKIKTLGGNLSVIFDNSFKNIYLVGPAKKVYLGEF
jgi:diaminopimelate epimerase